MSLIFDSFPSLQHAREFADHVTEIEPQLRTWVFETAADANAHDPFPYGLAPPIVHVERPSLDDDSSIERVRELGGVTDVPTGAEREKILEQLVTTYGGEYRGT